LWADRVIDNDQKVIQPYHVMLKPRGAICDLDCSYCYYLDKEALYPESSFRMTDEVLEAFTRQYLESQLSPEIVFGWQGGEPTLMGIDFFKRAVEFQDKYAPRGSGVLNTLQTNGVGLDAEWCEFFRENGFLIGISIDGPAAMHDAYRVDKGGKPTHERVMVGLELLREHGVEHNVLTTVHAANVHHALDVYRFLRDEVATSYMQFIPIVEREHPSNGSKVSSRSVTGTPYGEFLIQIFDEWVHKDIGSVFVQIFDVALSAWVGRRPGLCIFEETCGRALALEHNGDLYSCDHFVDPDYLVGNVSRTQLPVLVDGQKQREFGQDKKSALPAYCKECEVRFVCNGGCPKNRFTTTPDGEPGLNVLCGGYRPFFNHIDPAMRYMAEALQHQAPPAGIMELLENGTDDELNAAYGASPGGQR
jgi:serine-type anaerobic sulfatase-maturating enzyme